MWKLKSYFSNRKTTPTFLKTAMHFVLKNTSSPCWHVRNIKQMLASLAIIIWTCLSQTSFHSPHPWYVYFQMLRLWLVVCKWLFSHNQSAQCPSSVLAAAIHVTTVPRWPPALTPYAKSASWEYPGVTATPAKQLGPYQTARYYQNTELHMCVTLYKMIIILHSV